MKEVRCIETGATYPNAKEAAAAMGVTPGMLSHVLKGRQRTAAGYTWEYTGEVSKRPYKARKARGKVWKDENGLVFLSLKELAESKGMKPARVGYLMRDSDVFLNEWLTENKKRIVLEWVSPYWCVDNVRFLSRDEAVAFGRRLTNHLTMVKLHVGLDKSRRTGKSVVMVFGSTGWKESAADLFGEMV